MNRTDEFLKAEPNTMITVKEPILKTSQKLDLLRHLFSDTPIASFFAGLEQIEITALKSFIWDKTIEFGIRVQGKNFSQESILTRIKKPQSSDAAQENRMPEQQTIRQIEAICEIAKEYINKASHPEMIKSSTSEVNSI